MVTRSLHFFIYLLFLSSSLFAEDTTLDAWEKVGVFVGASPDDSLFKKLSDQDIRTVVSVDGLKPDVETAKKYGLSYIHLPIGDGGISDERINQFHTLIDTVDRPIYIHCHHGKHRGPTAAAIALILSGEFTNSQALQMLETFGTSKEYKGLWKKVREVKKASLLTHSPLPEISQVGSMSEQMAQVDLIFDRLKAFKSNDWQPLKEHPDTSAKHEALQLMESFFEFNRTQLHSATTNSTLKTEFLNFEKHTKVFYDGFVEERSADRQAKAFLLLKKSCRSCHREFRN